MKSKDHQPTEASTTVERDRIMLEHLPLVRAIAGRVRARLPADVEFDDLVQAGVLGLLDAARRFNPEKGVKFAGYAKYRIRGAILDSLRQLDCASRDLRLRYKRVEALTAELSITLQRPPTDSEIAEKLGIAVERWHRIRLDLRNAGLLSASTRWEPQGELPAPDFPSKPETQPDHICARVQTRFQLGTAIGALPERYKKVVVWYYASAMTMKQIGSALGINESRVSQIHKLALTKMQAVLQENGIHDSHAF